MQRTDLGADMVVVARLEYAEVMDDGDILEWFQLSMDNVLRCSEGDEVVCDKTSSRQ